MNCIVHITSHVPCMRKPIWIYTGLNLVFMSIEIYSQPMALHALPPTPRPALDGIWTHRQALFQLRFSVREQPEDAKSSSKQFPTPNDESAPTKSALS